MTQSQHAEKRGQQRGISGKTVEFILENGTLFAAPRGAQRVMITKKDQQKIRDEAQRLLKLVDRATNKEVVIDRESQDVITVQPHRIPFFNL